MSCRSSVSIWAIVSLLVDPHTNGDFFLIQKHHRRGVIFLDLEMKCRILVFLALVMTTSQLTNDGDC